MATSKVARLKRWKEIRARARHDCRLSISIFLCTIPLLDAITILAIVAAEMNRYKNSFFNYFVGLYACTSILTSFIGYFGIRHGTLGARRSALVLIIAENLIVSCLALVTMLSIILGVDIFAQHRAPPFFQYIERSAGSGIVICWGHMLLHIACIISSIVIGELEPLAFSLEEEGLTFEKSQDHFQIDIDFTG